MAVLQRSSEGHGNEQVGSRHGPPASGQEIEYGQFARRALKLGAYRVVLSQRDFWRQSCAILKDGRTEERRLRRCRPQGGVKPGTNPGGACPRASVAPAAFPVKSNAALSSCGAKARFTAPHGEAPFDEYSDPATRSVQGAPSHPVGFATTWPWANWLLTTRGGGLLGAPTSWCHPRHLTAEKISGQPIANLSLPPAAADSDWGVRQLIDLDPDGVGAQPEMVGYQLMVAADLSSAGPYRERFEAPSPRADKPRPVCGALFTPIHVFLPSPHHGQSVQLFPLSTAIRRRCVPIFSGPTGDYAGNIASTITPARHSSNCPIVSAHEAVDSGSRTVHRNSRDLSFSWAGYSLAQFGSRVKSHRKVSIVILSSHAVISQRSKLHCVSLDGTPVGARHYFC